LRVEAHHERLEDDSILRGRAEPLGVSRVETDRLFAQHVFASASGGERE
jgi:hypothetical protein